MNDNERPMGARRDSPPSRVPQTVHAGGDSGELERVSAILPSVLCELAAGAEDEFVAAHYRRLARRSFTAQARQAA